jgi:hypothetical protein
MRARALIHVAGPTAGGKTTFIEQIGRNVERCILAARCVRDDSLRRFVESAPKAHPELRRYRDAGADDAALFRFPGREIGSEPVFNTRLMENYSEAVFFEGDSPLGFADLAVFVAPPPAARENLLVRRTRDRAAEQRVKAEEFERALRAPDGLPDLLVRALGPEIVQLARTNRTALEAARQHMLTGLAVLRTQPPPKPTEHWPS